MGFLDFPLINETQYALLICQSSTGNILDKNLNRYKNMSDINVYFIFNSLDETHQFIEARKLPNTDFEIYDNNKLIVEVISFPSVQFVEKEEWWKWW